MSDPSEMSFVPSEDLELELDNVVIKLKNELKKMNLRIKDLEKKLKAKEKETQTIVTQNEERFKSLTAEMKRKEELLKEKESEMKTLQEKNSRENHYLQSMLKENQEHIKRLEEDMQSMNNDIKELNVEHSKENEKLKFELNETKLQLKKKLNAERLMTNEFEYKIENLKRERSELAHSLESTTKSLRLENEEKTRENQDLKAKMEKLESTITEMNNDIHKLKEITNRDTKNLKEENKRLKAFETNNPKLVKRFEELKQSFRQRLSKSDMEIMALKEEIEVVQNKNQSLTTEKQNLSLRLAKLSGVTLTIHNPNIADLSNEIRPTKLAEEFSEIYDNEWTGAFDDVNILNDKEKIAFLLELLKRANQLCRILANDYVKKIRSTLSMVALTTSAKPTEDGEERELTKKHQSHLVSMIISGCTNDVTNESKNEALETPQVDDKQDELEEEEHMFGSEDADAEGAVYLRELKLQKVLKQTVFETRRFFESKLPTEVSREVEKLCTDIIVKENRTDKIKPETVVIYIRKCLNVCWRMYLHEPPVHVDFPAAVTDQTLFDTDKFKAYTRAGKHVAYIVWPALYLHDSGPMLSKGYAQGK